MELASRCGNDVEVLDERTEWNTVYAQPDGQMRLVVSVSALRTRVPGEWTEIDTSLIATPGGIAPVAPAVEMLFSDGTPGQPLVWMQRDGHELTFDVPFPVGEPVVYGNTLEYRDVLAGVDLIVTVNADGTAFSEVLRVNSPQAAADPRIAELTFPVTVSRDLVLASSDGGFVAADAEGEPVFRSPPPAMWDSSADLAEPKVTPYFGGLRELTADGAFANPAVLENRALRVGTPLDGDQRSVMGVAVRGSSVAVEVDEEILTNPDTVWPVYIDPSVGGGPSSWINVSSGGWTRYNYAGDEGIGHCGTTGSPMYCSQVFTARSMWAFGGLGEISNVPPADVSQAVMSVYGTHSYSCTAYPVEAWRVSGFSASTTWATSGFSVHQSTQNVAHKAACGNARFIEFDVLEGARAVAQIHASGLSLGLKAQNEGSSTGWKRYQGNNATLSITYNRAPDLPTNFGVTAPQRTCANSFSRTLYLSESPATLFATLTDPDRGATVQGNFEIFQGTTQIWDPPLTAPQISGQVHSVPVPSGLLTDGTYSMRVNGQEPNGGRAGPVKSCTIVIDTAAPVPPAVTAVAGQPAVYLADTVAGGVGVAGRFTFASTSSDVDRFAYTINGVPASVQVNNTRTSKPVTFTPLTAGSQTLTVAAIDRAGNVSGETLYRFSVAFPGAGGVWLLDEGAGTTSADDTAGGNDLTLGNAAMWGPGLLAEVGADETDAALVFGGPDDTASSGSAVVAANESFTVSAFVRLDDDTAPRTAVSQDGVTSSGFELGYRTQDCPVGMDGCWAFAMNGADNPAPMPIVAASSVPVRTDSWVHLTGVHNAGTDELRLWVCEFGPVDELDPAPEPASSSPVAFMPTWNATGGLQLGRGQIAGAPASGWLGVISSVRAWTGALSESDIRTNCHNGS